MNAHQDERLVSLTERATLRAEARDEKCRRALKHLADGASKTEAAARVGVSTKFLSKWMEGCR